MERLQFASEDSVNFLKRWKELEAHYQQLAISHDNEMLAMIDVIDATRIEWSKSASECNRLTSLNESLQRENSNLTTELRNTQDLHLEAQAQLKLLHTTIQGLQHNITEYEKRFHLVKKILREQNAKLAADIDMDKLMSFPSSDSPRSSRASRTNTEEIDYDKTGDSFADNQFEDAIEAVPLRYNRTYQRRSKCQPSVSKSERAAVKRRSVSQQPMPFRNAIPENIAEEDEVSSSSTNENLVPRTPQPKRSRVQYFGGAETCTRESNKGHKKSSIRRSISESNLLETHCSTLRSQNPMIRSTLEMRTPHSIRNNTWTKGRRIAECGHIFRKIRFQMLGTCSVCSKSFSNTCYKCEKCDSCNCYVHEACVPDAPMPCVPPVKTPQKSQKRRRLADMCTNERPKLPPAIVRCVVALEKSYLNTVGLYRVPGSESELKHLLEGLHSNIPPNMKKFQPETICGAVKRILRDLQDPLIPNSSYSEFIKAADENNRDQLMTAIGELPLPNRHTLAYLCTHWQNVAHNSNVNQMPIENIATCLGPTIFGTASKFTCFQSNVRSEAQRQQNDVEAEARRQINVLRLLLQLDQSYWTNLLESPSMNDGFGSTHRTLGTPARRPLADMNADQSILGPVTRTPTGEPLIRPIAHHTADRIKFDRPY